MAATSTMSAMSAMPSVAFNLEGVDAEHITADYKNGVLMLNLPKIQPEPKKEARKIDINGQENA